MRPGRSSDSRPERCCADQVVGLILAGGAGRRMGGVDKGLVELAGRPLAQWVAEALRPQVAQLLISANRHREDYARLGCPVLSDRSIGDVSAPAGDRQPPSAAEPDARLKARQDAAHRSDPSAAGTTDPSHQEPPFQGPLAGIATALDLIATWPQERSPARLPAQAQAQAQAQTRLADQMQRDPAAAPGWLLVSPCDTPLIPHNLGARLATALAASQARIAIAADQERSQPLHALIPVDSGADLGVYLRGGGRSVLGWLARHRVAIATFEQIPSPFLNLNRPEDARRIQARLGLGP
ncbi:MAG: molybdenum cofactor guanylyltransferase [Halochromatium sp.]